MRTHANATRGVHASPRRRQGRVSLDMGARARGHRVSWISALGEVFSFGMKAPPAGAADGALSLDVRESAAGRRAPVCASSRRASRQSRALARWLRRTVVRADERDPIRRRSLPLMCDRVAAVRTDLLEIAALLDHVDDPDHCIVAPLRSLLANGCDSPLYNDEFHISELRAALYYIRQQLHAAVPIQLDPPPLVRTHPQRSPGFGEASID